MSEADLNDWKAAYRAGRPDTADTGLMTNGIAVLISDSEFPERGQLPDDSDIPWEYIRSLRDDLRRIRRGWQPSEVDLADAPELTDFAQIIGEDEHLPVLVGFVDGEFLRTEHVAAIDTGRRRWARTLTHWLRLAGASALRDGDEIPPAILHYLEKRR
ncbi:hypothetical protein SAMN05428997_13115 [Bosea sp. CRIB-10]|uniref:hypothetical protein n=1 Tax=Bosea sp. CRIB-10 TaxID=378404 RepID=UPI0008E6E0AE|nr:hypothetical protein [Bosea sp. CRIB-10]SFD51479.1 hypothetical protein SAMN05428997_13115 [Bosea sp. CRIB-10]